jgi:hypothetical protein
LLLEPKVGLSAGFALPSAFVLASCFTESGEEYWLFRCLRTPGLDVVETLLLPPESSETGFNLLSS